MAVHRSDFAVYAVRHVHASHRAARLYNNNSLATHHDATARHTQAPIAPVMCALVCCRVLLVSCAPWIVYGSPRHTRVPCAKMHLPNHWPLLTPISRIPPRRSRQPAEPLPRHSLVNRLGYCYCRATHRSNASLAPPLLVARRLSSARSRRARSRSPVRSTLASSVMGGSTFCSAHPMAASCRCVRPLQPPTSHLTLSCCRDDDDDDMCVCVCVCSCLSLCVYIGVSVCACVCVSLCSVMRGCVTRRATEQELRVL